MPNVETIEKVETVEKKENVTSNLADYKANLKLESAKNKRKSDEAEARKRWEAKMTEYESAKKSDALIEGLTKVSTDTVHGLIEQVKILHSIDADFRKDCYYFIEGGLHKKEAYKGDSKTKLNAWIIKTFSLRVAHVRNPEDDSITEISIETQQKKIDNAIRYLADKGRELLGIDKPEKKPNTKTKGDNAKKYIEKNLSELTDPERVDIARQLLNSLTDDNFASIIIIEKLKASSVVFEEVREYMRGSLQIEKWEKACLDSEITKETSLSRMKVEAVKMDQEFIPVIVKKSKKRKAKK